MRTILFLVTFVAAAPTMAQSPFAHSKARLTDREAIQCLREGALGTREARMLLGASVAFAEHRTESYRVAEACRVALRHRAMREASLGVAQTSEND